MDQIQDKEEKFPEVIIDILKTKHWDYKQTEVNPPTIRWEYTGDHGKWSIYLKYIPAATTLVCYSVFPVDAPLRRRTEMLTLITRLNVMVTGGSFQMDLDDGEILFKTSLFFDNIELTHALVGNIIEQNLKLMNQCFRGMMAVMYKKCSVEDGIRLIEAQEIT